MRRTIGRRRSAVRLLLLLAAAGLALLPLARAAAHAELARAEPPPGALVSEPPRTVRLWFTERVEPRFTTVRVLDSNARQVESGLADTNPADPTNVAVGVEPLADGTYTVAWQALSAVDGHVTQGLYTFTVGKVSLLQAPVEAAPPSGGGYPFGSAAVRWLVFLGALGAVGGYVFRALVLEVGSSAPEAAAIAARRWSALVWWWLGLAALASVAALTVQADQATGNPWSPTDEPPLFAIATGTAWGHVWLARMAFIGGLMAVTVLLATGALTALQPGRDAWARMERPLTLERTAGDFTVRLMVDPARLGANSYTATLTDARGRPVTNAEARLRLTFLEADVAAQEVTLSSAGEGRYQAQGAELSLRGLWQALVAVQRPGGFDTQAVFRFGMPPTTPGDSEARLPRIHPTLGRRTILGLEVAVAGLVLLAIGWRLREWALQAGALVAVIGLAVVAFGGFLAGRAQVAPEAPALAVQVNPVEPDMQSLQVGRILYEGQCTVCHGAAGHGDGPQAASLTPPPLDLTVHVPLHPDGEVFGFVARGVPGTAMPAFGAMFKDEEVWHLVNYLHQLADAAKQGAGATPTPAVVPGARAR